LLARSLSSLSLSLSLSLSSALLSFPVHAIIIAPRRKRLEGLI